MRKSLFIIVMALLSGCNSEQVIGEDMSSKKSSSPLLTRYIVGKPYMPYFDAERAVALRWGINLKHIFAGSKNREEIEQGRLDVQTSNVEANYFYDKKFGEGWEVRFKEEVEAEKSK